MRRRCAGAARQWHARNAARPAALRGAAIADGLTRPSDESRARSVCAALQRLAHARRTSLAEATSCPPTCAWSSRRSAARRARALALEAAWRGRTAGGKSTVISTGEGESTHRRRSASSNRRATLGAHGIQSRRSQSRSTCALTSPDGAASAKQRRGRAPPRSWSRGGCSSMTGRARRSHVSSAARSKTLQRRLRRRVERSRPVTVDGQRRDRGRRQADLRATDRAADELLDKLARERGRARGDRARRRTAASRRCRSVHRPAKAGRAGRVSHADARVFIADAGRAAASARTTKLRKADDRRRCTMPHARSSALQPLPRDSPQRIDSHAAAITACPSA